MTSPNKLKQINQKNSIFFAFLLRNITFRTFLEKPKLRTMLEMYFTNPRENYFWFSFHSFCSANLEAISTALSMQPTFGPDPCADTSLPPHLPPNKSETDLTHSSAFSPCWIASYKNTNNVTKERSKVKRISDLTQWFTSSHPASTDLSCSKVGGVMSGVREVSAYYQRGGYQTRDRKYESALLTPIPLRVTFLPRRKKKERLV